MARKRLAKSFLYAYILCIAAYAIYGGVQEVWPVGQITALQLQWFGFASTRVSAALAFLTMLLPACAARKFLRSSGIFTEEERIVGLDPAARPNGPASPMSMKKLLWVSAVPTALALVAYVVVELKSVAHSQFRQGPEEVHQLQISKVLDRPDLDKAFVQLEAVTQLEYVFRIELKQGYGHTNQMAYVPLTIVSMDASGAGCSISANYS